MKPEAYRLIAGDIAGLREEIRLNRSFAQWGVIGRLQMASNAVRKLRTDEGTKRSHDYVEKLSSPLYAEI